MRPLLAALAVHSLMSAAGLVAQEPAPPASADTTAALAVFLDCHENGCDLNYFQEEIKAITWVRDRNFADVHILVTGQPTGASGREYTVTFIGLRQYSSLTDTLRFATLPAATTDDRRKGLARTFRSGLVRYLARTSMADKVSVTFATTGGARPAAPQRDPWKAWVFEASFGTFFFGEETYKSYDRWGEFSANRITKAWKTQLGFGRNQSRSENELDDTTTYVNTQSGFNASLLQVKSLGEHWSLGLRANVNGSTYDNFNTAVRITPAIEFNAFPYSTSTRRQLRIEYNAGYAHFAYNDSTVNDKLSEGKPIHRVQISLSSREPWGNSNVGVNAVHYLGDSTQYRIGVFGGASLRLAKGFNVNVNGNYQSIHDQFYLAKKNFSQQEILLRQFQFGTKYRFWGNVNISYTFGSIFSTVVNPRFGGNFD